MWDEFEQLEVEHTRLSQHKRICTGEPLEPLSRAEIPKTVLSLADFRTLVSEVYKCWHEQWGQDVAFLLTTTRAATPKTQDFKARFQKIRTAHEHSTNAGAVRVLQNWYYEACGTRTPQDPNEWAICARKLILQLTNAITELADAAMSISQSENQRNAWQQHSATSVRAVVVRIAIDLGLSLRESAIGYHTRQVENQLRWYRSPKRQNASAELDSLVERSLMSQSPALPCDHMTILRELEVIGSRSAFAGIQLAHAVAAVSHTRGDAFLKLVAASWASIQPA
ncbi:hypothetical protein [Amycolatopsis sp. WAC 04197]|uniref:hypothetical protein n=1 Tax=Amycolatopsis sp. WAC 04197 TaxID=2203199 RepID=UPI000F770BE2|nr:hypothetical protein [Amycolatopsis sp. WAC 04197]